MANEKFVVHKLVGVDGSLVLVVFVNGINFIKKKS